MITLQFDLQYKPNPTPNQAGATQGATHGVTHAATHARRTQAYAGQRGRQCVAHDKGFGREAGDGRAREQRGVRRNWSSRAVWGAAGDAHALAGGADSERPELAVVMHHHAFAWFGDLATTNHDVVILHARRQSFVLVHRYFTAAAAEDDCTRVVCLN